MSTTEINWGYNCLTVGVHHGRPEPLWNLPLLQAVRIFPAVDLKEIVITRIYNDAMQFVVNGTMTQEWPDRVRDLAVKRYSGVLRPKLSELYQYYTSPEFNRDVQGMIERLKENKLNPGYRPLHGHDSINQLCRHIGVSASIEASKN